MRRSVIARSKFSLEERLKDLQRVVEKLELRNLELTLEVHTNFAAITMFDDFASAPTIRYLPVSLYTSSEDRRAFESLRERIENLSRALGMDRASELPEQRGSWYQKWFAKTREVVSQPELKSRLEKAERAAELQVLDRPQAQVDRNLARAVKDLLDAVKNESHVAIQVGSLLIVKSTHNGCPQTIVRTLTQRELFALGSNAHWLQSPADICTNLDRYAAVEHTATEESRLLED